MVQAYGCRVKRQSVVIATLVALLAGCASQPRASQWTGPSAPAPVSVDRWDYSPQDEGKLLRTPHYLIHTTIGDPDILAKLPQVMEGAYSQYAAFVGPNPLSSVKPMRCYVFSKRSEWADFTSRHTGTDASIYLQITRGGYTIGDWFVSYYVGEAATYSVASHEGWHQYVSRNFKGRLPPFLEEGTACMFENVRIAGDLPRWDLTTNFNRSVGLRTSIEENKLWKLDKLVTLHAGDVVRLPGDRIEAFYAQNWAFARFLWEFNNGQYRPPFKQLLADTAAGTSYDPGGTLHRASNMWSPSSVRPMLEHYLGKNLDQIEVEYNQFMKKIAYEQFGRQWASHPG
jgi:hypothetical protein